MAWSTDRRRGGEDLRTATILRALSDDLATVSDLVESVRTDQKMPRELTERLEVVDRELTRMGQLAREAAAVDLDEATETHRLAGHLTRREWQCLGLLVHGHSTSAIAGALGVSTTTARTHIQSLLTKLGVHSRLQAVALTIRTSLLTSAPGAEA
jgi:ATP/maltotriose-dependent transcriptional regulator MalT